MPTLDEWPTECLLLLTEHIHFMRDINALAQTTKRFYSIFNPYLYRHGIKVNGLQLQDTLTWALRHGEVNTVQRVLQTSIDPQVFDDAYSHQTILHRAVEYRIQQVPVQARTRARLEEKWGITSRRKYPTRPLECFDAAILLLLDRGADINNLGKNCRSTCLGTAVYARDNELIRLLLEHGADPAIRNYVSNQNILDSVLSCGGDPGAMTLILEQGLDINERDLATVLHCAVAKGFTSAVTVLIQHGADLNIRDKSGLTPLHYAVRGALGQRPEMVAMAQLLIEGGADVNAACPSGWTPLHMIAAMGTCTELFSLLVDSGANLEAQDCAGRTPEDLARSYGREEMRARISHLLSRSATILLQATR